MTNSGVVIVGVINDGLSDATLTSSLTALSEVKGQTKLTFSKVALRGVIQLFVLTKNSAGIPCFSVLHFSIPGVPPLPYQARRLVGRWGGSGNNEGGTN